MQRTVPSRIVTTFAIPAGCVWYKRPPRRLHISSIRASGVDEISHTGSSANIMHLSSSIAICTRAHCLSGPPHSLFSTSSLSNQWFLYKNMCSPALCRWGERENYRKRAFQYYVLKMAGISYSKNARPIEFGQKSVFHLPFVAGESVKMTENEHSNIKC